MKNKASRSALSLITSALILASCGGETASAPAPVTQPENTPTVTSETVQEPSYLDAYADTDLGGASYTIATFSSEYYPNYTGEDITGEPVNDIQCQRDSWIEEHYNVKLAYNSYSDDRIFADLQKQIQAGDETNDCIEAGMTGVLCPLSAAGMLADLKGVDGLDLSTDWWSQSMNQAFTINDHIFITTGPIAFSYYYSPRVVAFNLRLAADHDLPDLYSMVDAGKWTLDSMADLMKDFSQDLDGDGKMGDDDLWAASVDEYSAAGFFVSSGGTQTAYDKDGKPYFVLDDQKNVDIIEKVASIIGNATMTQKAEELANRSGTWDIRDKVYTFKSGKALFLGYGAQAIALYLRDMPDDYGIIPVPKYDESQKDYITFGNAFVPAYIGIPRTNSRGEINGILLDSMGYISRRDVQPLVSEITLKGKAARDAASQRMLDIIYKDIYLDLNSSYDFGGAFTLIRDITMGKRSDFVSGWQKNIKISTRALDKLYEQFIEIDN